MYRYDTHIHTQETSPCGQVEACQVVRLYKDAGYEGIVITDHYYNGFFQTIENLPWEEQIEVYLKGYREAVHEGAKVGLTVLLGMELRFDENANDYLVYGITETFLKENRNLHKLTLRDFKKLCENKNILIFQAHPYRAGMEVANPNDIDGVEIFNGNPRHDSRNHLAYSFAKENHLMMISGSDFHQPQDLARGGIIISEKIESPAQLVDAFNQQKTMDYISTQE